MLLHELAPLIIGQEVTVTQSVEGIDRTVFTRGVFSAFPVELQNEQVAELRTYPTEHAGIADAALSIILKAK